MLALRYELGATKAGVAAVPTVDEVDVVEVEVVVVGPAAFEAC